MYEEELAPVPDPIKQMRHIELLERVQQLPEYKGEGKELRVAGMSRDRLLSILLSERKAHV